MTSNSVLSEPQLMAALAANGRMTPATDIAAWRKAGLLPPLASHGRGPGKGRFHCWHDAGIVGRAEIVFDATRRYGRNDLALLTLFLSGYAVPLPQLRRAWIHRAKLRKVPAIRAMALPGSPSGSDASGPLPKIAMALGAAIQTDHSEQVVTILERALVKLGYQDRRGEHICKVLMAMESALEASGLVARAEDEELTEAQRYLRTGLCFLRGCTVDGEDNDLTATLGPTLFVFILTLLRAGHRTVMDDLVLQMEDRGRPAAAAPIAMPAQAAE